MNKNNMSSTPNIVHQLTRGEGARTGTVQHADVVEFLNQIRQLESETSQLRREAQASRIKTQRLMGELESVQGRARKSRDELRSDLKELSHKLTAASAEANELRRTQRPDAEIIRAFQAGEVERAGKYAASATRPVVNVGLGPQYFYGSLHHKDIRVIERIAMKNKSTAARDAIAMSATHLLLGNDDLLRIARAFQAGILDANSVSIYRTWIPRSLTSFARILSDQQLRPTDLVDAAAVYELALALWGHGRFDTRDRLIYSEILDTLGRRDKLETFIQKTGLKEAHPVQCAFYAANECRRAGRQDDEWLKLLNTQLVTAGFAPVLVDTSHEDTLEGLRVDAPAAKDGPLVTVIMPTFNGSQHIRTAAKSVLNQTWSNLELIIVDDHSDDEHWEYLKHELPTDERLSLYRLPENQGAYRARRLAFEHAQGEFVTVHDDDDWSHPQKIETQVQHLLKNEGAIANMSMMVRVDQDAMFVRINDNPEFNQKNYSSMMVRRDDVTRLGVWDDLNRAADAEFHDRIFAATGQRVNQIDTPPLSFMRARSGSLTSGEINKGALDFGRQTYGLLYGAWHEKIKSSSSPTVEAGAFDPERRPFMVPKNFLPKQRTVQLGKFDVIYCTDFRFPGGNSTLTNSEIRAAVAAGLRVGIVQLDSPVLRAPRAINPNIASTLLDLEVPVLTIEDPVETALLIIRNPTVLQYAENLTSSISPDRVIVVANTAPASIGGRDACYNMATCAANAETVWSARAEVIAESPQTRSLIVAMEPDTEVSEEFWPGFVEDDTLSTSRSVRPDTKPTVGRHSRDHRLKWPDSEEAIRAAYHSPELFETRILGGADSVKQVADLHSLGCEVLPFGALDAPEFLKDVDFWVYMHSSALVESFGMAIVEAMASGCVVVLPPYMEGLFGNGAIYAEPGDIQSVVGNLWSDAELFESQSARGISVVRERFSSSAYAQRLASLVRADSA